MSGQHLLEMNGLLNGLTLIGIREAFLTVFRRKVGKSERTLDNAESLMTVAGLTVMELIAVFMAVLLWCPYGSSVSAGGKVAYIASSPAEKLLTGHLTRAAGTFIDAHGGQSIFVFFSLEGVVLGVILAKTVLFLLTVARRKGTLP